MERYSVCLWRTVKKNSASSQMEKTEPLGQGGDMGVAVVGTRNCYFRFCSQTRFLGWGDIWTETWRRLGRESQGCVRKMNARPAWAKIGFGSGDDRWGQAAAVGLVRIGGALISHLCSSTPSFPRVFLFFRFPENKLCSVQFWFSFQLVASTLLKYISPSSLLLLGIKA